MPVHNQFFLDNNRTPSPSALARAGPVLPVEVTVPTPLAQYLQKQGAALPQPIAGLALVDTGASISCVDQQVVAKLGVNPIGVVMMGTAGGPNQQHLYPAKLRFPAQQMEFEFESVVGANLSGQGVGRHRLLVLLGRDVLSRCVLIYNGSLGVWTLGI